MLMIWKQVNIFLPDSQTVIKEVGVPRWQAPLCSIKSHPDWEQKYKVNSSSPSWNRRYAWQLVLLLMWNCEHLAPSQFWGENCWKNIFSFGISLTWEAVDNDVNFMRKNILWLLVPQTWRQPLGIYWLYEKLGPDSQPPWFFIYPLGLGERRLPKWEVHQ